MEINKSTSDYLIELLRAAVRQQKASEKPEDVDWNELLSLAVYHKVDELAFYSISRLQIRPEGDAGQKWKGRHERNQILDTVQRSEADVIVEFVSKEQIGILPLKGAVMKTFYPKSELRQMSDLDYLVEPCNIEKVDLILEKLGYDADDVGSEDSHDVYKKLPYMEVEVHRRLLPPTEENHWHTDNIWERLVHDKDNQYLMNMTWEDFYLYHLLHFEKHYSMEGAGIRAIIDEYFFIKKFYDKLDWNYIDKCLKKMNYVEFEKMCRGLAESWFGDEQITEELKGPAEFIMNSGAFGTFEQYQKWSFERYKREQGIKSKRGYFFRRMFMERERMEFIYPSLKKHRWLLPFCWIHRLFRAVFLNRGRVKMEMKSFKNKD